MDRITVKLDKRTHRRLIAALPELSVEAGLMLTTSEAVEWLLAQHYTNSYASPGVPAGWEDQPPGVADAQA